MPFPAFMPTGQDRYRGTLPQNWFFAKDDEKGPQLWGTPGLSLWTDLGSDVMMIRGMNDMGDYLYVVAQTSDTSCTVYQIDKYGTFVSIGTIATGTGPLYIVPMANGKQILFNDNVNGYYYDTYPKTWVQSSDYLIGIVVQPITPNLLYYKCTVPGTASTSEPTWPTVVGATVTEQIAGPISSISMGSGGGSYHAADVLTLVGGGGSGAQITVDTVDGGGVILTWHLSNAGINYLPANGLGVTGGVGSAATFNILLTTPGPTWECISGIPYFAKITDPAFLGGGPAVLQDNYVVYAQPDGNEWGVSKLADCTTYDANAQATKGADIIWGVLSSHLNIWLLGKKNIEIWYDAGTSPFPFAKLVGTLIEKGLGAPMSAVIGENTVLWLSSDRQVFMASGFQPKRISTDKIDKELEGYAKVSDALGFFQIQRGHSFYWLIFPSANRTFVCDVSVNPPEWHTRNSFPNESRHRANCYHYFNGMHLIGDYSTGKIYKLDPIVYMDDDNPLISRMQSREYRAGGKLIQFPDLQLLFDSGQGLQGTDPAVGVTPQVMLRASKDGGKTFGNEREASMGKVGESTKRTLFRQNGVDFQRIYEVSVSDPVNRDILSVDWITE